MHPFSDGSGVAFFDTRTQQAQTINCPYDYFVDMISKDSSALTAQERNLIISLQDLNLI